MRLGASIERTQRPAMEASFDRTAMDAALASRAFWKDLCESIGDLMFETDRQGRFVFLAPNEVLGHQAHALIGHAAADLLYAAGASAHGFNPFASQRAMRMQHAWLQRRDGSVALFAFSGHPTGSGGMRGVAVDVTRTEEAARRSADAILTRAMVDRIVDRVREEVLAPRMARAGLSELVDCLGAQGAAIALMPVALGPAPDPHGQPATLSAAYSVGFGWDELAPRLRSFLESELLADGATAVVQTECGHALVCSSHNRFGSPTALILWRRSGQAAWRDADRTITVSVAKALRGVIEQDNIQRHMTDQARTDLLTGLLSRRSFLEETRRRTDRLDGDGAPAVLLSVNLDDFRAINDLHGPERGDEALCQAAALLRDAVRPTDLVCRTVGDSFAIWLDGADMFAAAERAEWLCRDGISIVLDGEVRRIGLSIGIACRPANSLEPIEDLFRRADTALMHAKRNGKGAWRASQQEIET